MVNSARKKSVMYPVPMFDTSPKYSAESIIQPRSTMKMEFSSMAKSNDESARGAISIVIKNVDGSNSSSSGFNPH